MKKTTVESRLESGPFNLSLAIRNVQKEWDQWCEEYTAIDDRMRKLENAIAWVIKDAAYKTPEQIDPAMARRWIEHLQSALSPALPDEQGDER